MRYSQVPQSIYSLFKSKLKERFSDSLEFPEAIHFNTIYKAVYSAAIQLRKMRSLWEVSFVVFESEAPYMDYYARGDDYSIHQRMDEKGNVINLENFEGDFGWPVYEDEIKTKEAHEAIRRHNQTVQQILVLKGFLK